MQQKNADLRGDFIEIDGDYGHVDFWPQSGRRGRNGGPVAGQLVRLVLGDNQFSGCGVGPAGECPCAAAGRPADRVCRRDGWKSVPCDDGNWGGLSELLIFYPAVSGGFVEECRKSC